MLPIVVATGCGFAGPSIGSGVASDAQAGFEPTASDAPDLATCPTSAGWLVIGGGHYYFSPNGSDKTWWNAEAACEAMTGSGPSVHLVVLETKLEAQAVAAHQAAPS